MPREWISVTKNSPCPLCGAVKWCTRGVFGNGAGGGLEKICCEHLAGAPGENGYVLTPRPPRWESRNASPWRIYVRAQDLEAWNGGGAGGAGGDGAGGGGRGRESPEDREKRKRGEEDERRRKMRAALDLWKSAAGSEDHPAARAYFAARGIELDRLPGGKLPRALRYLSSCDYHVQGADGGWRQLKPGPAVLCAAVNEADELVAVQRIYLAIDGSPKKRAKEDCRTADGDEGESKQCKGPISGGAVRLHAGGQAATSGAGAGVLLLCEGIETGLALLAATGRTVWACVSAGNVRAVRMPERLKGEFPRALMCLDHDSVVRDRQGKVLHRTGRRDANLAAGAWRERGIEARVSIPEQADCPGLIGPAPGSEDQDGDILDPARHSVDWLDVYTAVGAAGVRVGIERRIGGEAKDQGDTSGDGEGGGGGDDGDGGGDAWGVKDPEGRPVLPAGDNLRGAVALRGLWAPEKAEGERWRLAYFPPKEAWLEYVGTHYKPVRMELVRSRLLHYFERFVALTPPGAKKEPERRTARDYRRAALSANQCEAIMRAGLVGNAGIFGNELPVWMPATFDDRAEPVWGMHFPVEGSSVVSFANGLLDVRALVDGKIRLLRHTPRYISLSSAPYTIDTVALRSEMERDPSCSDRGDRLAQKLCPHFRAFLENRFPEDHVSRWLLLQFLGLCFTTDTSFEQSLFLIGPPGSGKGTTVDVFTAVLGEDAIASTSFKELTERFEIGKLVGKHVALLDEARLGHTTDSVEAGRRLNSMIGGAPVSSDVKYGEKTEFVRPKCRFLLTANELPRMMDASAALVRRLLVLPFPERGAEIDRSLKPRLVAEAPGIAAWALLALKDLYRVGKFVPTAEGLGMVEEFQRLASPVYAFVKDCCVFEHNSTVPTKLLYELYCAWAKSEGLQEVAAERFGNQLRAVNANVRRERLREAGRRSYVYLGVRPRLLTDQDSEGRDITPPKAADVDSAIGTGPFDFSWSRDEYLA